tara:strand:- start:185 stop:520 length:336 start_codon:yes stop_codon:yes gene_type:complete
MPFKQGRAKTGGRAKGSSNKTTKDIREVAAMILSNEMEGLENRLPDLKDSDYIKAIGMLMKAVLPSQKQIELDSMPEFTNFQVEIIDRIEQVSNQDIDKGIDNWVDDQRNK